MIILTYDEFFSEVWDNFSDNCITDEYYEENKDVIRDFIHTFYELYKKTSRIEEGYFKTDLGPRRAAKLLESILKSLINFGYKCV